jgi:hypothetical protein
MQGARHRQAGRPTTIAREGEKTTLSLRVTPTLKRRLDEEGKEDGRNLSQEAERRLEKSFDDEDALTRAAQLAFGPNAGLAFLSAEVAKAISPHAEWIDDEIALVGVARALVHALRQLRSPADARIPEDNDDSVEARVSRLIFDFGLDDGSGFAALQRAKRERLGPAIAERLIEWHRVAKQAKEDEPPREMARPAPDDAAVWEHTIARLIAQAEAERSKRRVEGIRRQIGRLAEMDAAPAYRAHERRLIEFRIATLDDADNAVRKELLDLLASASPEAESA